MKSIHVSERLMHEFSEIGVRASKPQLKNLAMLCAALAVSANCHLNTLALELPVPGDRDSLVQRLRRWLKTGPSWERAYRPMVVHLFKHWTAREVALVMDRTDLDQQHLSVLTLGVGCGKRLLPLTWKVLPFGGTGAETQLMLLRQIQPLLPIGCRVTFMGDAEFRAVPVQAYCRAQGWHWHVGVKSDARIKTAENVTMALIDLPVKRGQTAYFQNVLFTEKYAFGPVNVLARCFVGDAWPHFWVLDLPADRKAWRRGRKRYWIEATFRDWKSYGFDLERCRIDCPHRLNALLLALAITTLWMIHLGQWCTRAHRRHFLESRSKRDYSLFRLGRDYLQRARTMDWFVPVGFTVTHPPAHTR